MSKAYKPEYLIFLIREECKITSLRKVAARYGISPAYLSDMIRGNRSISDTVAGLLGFDKRVVTTMTFTRKLKP